MKLRIFDSNRQEVQLGDLVEIQSKRNDGLTFFARVQIIKHRIFPFDMFAYDRVFKIDSLPDDVKHAEAKGNMPEYWMHPRWELKEGFDVEAWKRSAFLFDQNPFYAVEE